MTSSFRRSIRPSRVAALGVSLVLAGSLLPASTAQAAAPPLITSRFFGASDHSPGGTAATGLASLERAGVRGAIIDGVLAAMRRAAELG